MKRVWVLGAGQLGTMLRYSGLPLALEVIPIDIDHPQELPLGADDIITAEREQWPNGPATNQLSAHPGFVNGGIFARLADRQTQKQALDELGIPTSPWLPAAVGLSAATAAAKLGSPFLLKRRTGAYDGRGQIWIDADSGEAIPEDWLGSAIAEQKIPFADEVSVIGVRDSAGLTYFYPLSLNLHVNGILMASLAPVERIASLQDQAEKMLGRLMDGIDYVGVMAMECFRVGDKLLVNEVAPRVHNSGHWTLAGSHMSQFEAHLRAVADLPLTPFVVKGRTAMINLIGTAFDRRWLNVAGAEVWWYDKEVRPGRKVGHINLCTDSHQQMSAALALLAELLPASYGPVIDWLLGNLGD